MKTDDDKKSLALRAFNDAKKYFESALILEDHISKAGNANVAPGVVLCLLFALELLLKAIVLIDRDEIYATSDLDRDEKKLLDDHEFSKLFDRIPGSIKDAVSLRLSSEFGSGLDKVELRRRLKKEYKAAFVKWRYIHEGGDGAKIDISFVKQLFRALVDSAVSFKSA